MSLIILIFPASRSIVWNTEILKDKKNSNLELTMNVQNAILSLYLMLLPILLLFQF